MPRIKLCVNTGFAGSKHVDYIDIDDAEWDLLSEEERDKQLDLLAVEFMNNHIGCDAYVMEEDNDDN